MNCPKCGKELRQGWLATSRAWSPEKKAVFIDLDRDVELWGVGDRNRRLPTGICEDCRILVSEY